MDTGKLIFELLDRTGMEQKEFAQKINVSEKTVSAWRNGRAKSYTKHLKIIADVLGTTTDYLHTGKEGAAVPSAAEQQLDSALAAELATATPEEVMLVRAYIQGLKAARKAAPSPDK